MFLSSLPLEPRIIKDPIFTTKPTDKQNCYVGTVCAKKDPPFNSVAASFTETSLPYRFYFRAGDLGEAISPIVPQRTHRISLVKTRPSSRNLAYHTIQYDKFNMRGNGNLLQIYQML